MAELESDGTKTRGGIADFLREFADELDRADPRPAGTEPTEAREADPGTERGSTTERDATDTTGEPTGADEAESGAADAERITLIVGGDSATVTVPETVEFDVEVDSRSPLLGSGVHQEIDFTLSWEVEDPDQTADELIQIE